MFFPIFTSLFCLLLTPLLFCFDGIYSDIYFALKSARVYFHQSKLIQPHYSQQIKQKNTFAIVSVMLRYRFHYIKIIFCLLTCSCFLSICFHSAQNNKTLKFFPPFHHYFLFKICKKNFFLIFVVFDNYNCSYSVVFFIFGIVNNTYYNI